MSDDRLFAGSIPELYERHLVPLIFADYARDLAARVQAAQPHHVLELAAGTGALTRAMAASLPQATIVATDLNQAMLDEAARHPHGHRVAWRRADAQALPFPDESFDAVACQFGVMFFPEKIEAYREAARVLKPGGRFFFNTWDGIAANEFAEVVTEALAALFPDNAPRFMARVPHGYHDTARIRADLAGAGFAEAAIDTVEGHSQAPAARDVAIAYCQGTPLRSEIEARGAARLEEATRVAEAALAARFGAGAIAGRIRAHVVTAWR